MEMFTQRIKAGEVMFGATVMEYLRPSLVKTFCNAGFDFIFTDWLLTSARLTVLLY